MGKLTPQEEYMRAAIEEAVKAKKIGNYAIGAVIVKNNKIIARAHNATRSEKDPTAHAEISAIHQAAKILGQKNLNDCILYTTHEPCPMCATAAVWAHLNTVIVGATMADMKKFHLENKMSDWKWKTIPISAAEIFSKGEPPVQIITEFMRDECCQLFHA